MLLELVQASRRILPAIIPYNMFLRKKILFGVFFNMCYISGVFHSTKYYSFSWFLVMNGFVWIVTFGRQSIGRKRKRSWKREQGRLLPCEVLMEGPGSAMPRDLRTASQTWRFWSGTGSVSASLCSWQCFSVLGSCGWDDWCWQAYLNKKFIAVWSWLGFAGARSGVGAREARPRSWRAHGHSGQAPQDLCCCAVHGNEVAVGWHVLEQIAEGAARR